MSYIEHVPYDIHTFEIPVAPVNLHASRLSNRFSLRETLALAAQAHGFVGWIAHPKDFYLLQVAIPCEAPERLDHFQALFKKVLPTCADDLRTFRRAVTPGDTYQTPTDFFTSARRHLPLFEEEFLEILDRSCGMADWLGSGMDGS
ncbi:hypothetical protein PAPYR_8288 [Paratrimastix pyriformis]|uniref:Uncharacterized protein n=1 Tax=Paratrimastix pyriformis TaxID=342808 RepID=A0ABQ8UAY4_9EUKA|nr:hypothetical protein PAPYR_8288 [Paratrimastix pyriformis]